MMRYKSIRSFMVLIATITLINANANANALDNKLIIINTNSSEIDFSIISFEVNNVPGNGVFIGSGYIEVKVTAKNTGSDAAECWLDFFFYSDSLLNNIGNEDDSEYLSVNQTYTFTCKYKRERCCSRSLFYSIVR